MPVTLIKSVENILFFIVVLCGHNDNEQCLIDILYAYVQVHIRVYSYMYVDSMCVYVIRYVTKYRMNDNIQQVLFNFFFLYYLPNKVYNDDTEYNYDTCSIYNISIEAFAKCFFFLI